jgi:hypothetical protein
MKQERGSIDIGKLFRGAAVAGVLFVGAASVRAVESPSLPIHQDFPGKVADLPMHDELFSPKKKVPQKPNRLQL